MMEIGLVTGRPAATIFDADAAVKGREHCHSDRLCRIVTAPRVRR